MADVANNITPGVITDRSGNTFDVVDVDGVLLPKIVEELIKTDFKEHLKNIRTLKIRDDDVIICAYCKAGTHWIWEVVQMLRGKTSNYQKEVKEKQMLLMNCTKDIDNQPSPRVLNSHLMTKHLPQEIFEKKTKIIYLIRNPKDTTVSYYHHFNIFNNINYGGDIHDFIDLFMNKEVPFGNWFDYVLEWEKFIESSQQPIYNLSYEDMTENPKHHVRELARFLEIDVSEEFIESVVKACSFQNLKKAHFEIKDDIFKPFIKENHSMYRKGKIGDWKNYFTVGENEEFDEVLQEKMKESKLKFRYC